jgi:hypothetical protein
MADALPHLAPAGMVSGDYSDFVPCDVPFGSIGKVRPIDNVCGPEGTGSVHRCTAPKQSHRNSSAPIDALESTLRGALSTHVAQCRRDSQ